MINIQGYSIGEKVKEKNNIIVYKGQNEKTQQTVLIKTPNSESYDPAIIFKLICEYEILHKSDIPGIIKLLKLERTHSSIALIAEDGGEMYLENYLRTKPLGLDKFFDIAVQLAEIIGKIHKKNIINRNISPDTIMIHPETGRVKIVDFSSAVIYSTEEKDTSFSNISATPLAYRSPEEMGQLKSSDFRADLYSLGVVFYEILTGKLPLLANNPAGWVYTLMTKSPVPPHTINSSIPSMLSDIIMKLLAKNAEERYQGAGGLLADLIKCRSQWTESRIISPFTPGEKEKGSHFILPQILYGREQEVKILTKAFEDTCSGQGGLLLISGYPGTGKTSLINLGLKPLAMEKGFYITGKFDQLCHNTPYLPIIEAFSDLIRQILTESPARLERWRSMLRRTLGRSGAIITEVIPEVEIIIGPQPPVEILGPKEAENRFKIVMNRFISVFAQAEHPLVIFLDDLQWVDPASLELIRYLSENWRDRYLLLIGAFRDNEVTNKHPLTLALTSISSLEIPLHFITVEPLNYLQTSQFVMDTMKCDQKKPQMLHEVFYRKSGGNPFFLGQMLRSVYDENLLNYNVEKGRWECDPASVQRMQLPNDVIVLMLRKLHRLPVETREVLKIASCIGNSFDLGTLSITYEKKEIQTALDLWPAVLEGLVTAVDNSEAKGAYQFLHDRVQQAAYSLIPEDRKKETHLRIGRLLLQNTIKAELEQKLFTIMNQLNHGLDLITELKERLLFAEYNLKACRRAKDSTAFSSALNYAKAGMFLLPENSWNEHYQLMYNLSWERAQCEYLCTYHDKAVQLLETLLTKAKTDLERAEIYGLKTILHSGILNYSEAIKVGIKALKYLGVDLPSQPVQLDLGMELQLTKSLLGSRRVEELFNLPEVSDPIPKKAMEILIHIAPGASSENPTLFVFVLLKLVNLSLQFGNADLSSTGYAGYGIVSGSLLGDYKTAKEFQKLAIKLCEKYNKPSSNCMSYFTIGTFTNHWTDHVKKNLEFLDKGYHYGLESGQLLYTSFTLTQGTELKSIAGMPLPDYFEECKNNYLYGKRIKANKLALVAATYGRLARNLMGYHNSPYSSTGKILDEDAMVKEVKQGDFAGKINYSVVLVQEYYLLGEHTKALAEADSIRQYIAYQTGFYRFAQHNFYESLTILAKLPHLSPEKKEKYGNILDNNQQRMKTWTEACPENFEHKYLIVEAERAHLSGDGQRAMALYDQAIQSARKNQYIQNEALANELAARFHLAAGRKQIARVYLSEAWSGYYRWGAVAKARALEYLYPKLLTEIVAVEEKLKTAEVLQKAAHLANFSHINKGSGKNMDLYTLRKAVATLSTEKDSTKLLNNFLLIAMEYAGANRGYLLLEKKGELFIEAAIEEQKITTIASPLNMEKNVNISRPIVRYVARTSESVVINERNKAGIFSRDAYLAKSSVQAVACMPLLSQDIPIGVLYLENILLHGIFTTQRMEMLQFLSDQLANLQRMHTFLGNDHLASEKKDLTQIVDFPLTVRELDVLGLIAAGLSNKEIAKKLGLKINTVKTHIINIYGKLQVNRRVQAVSRAKELKLVGQ